MTKSQKVEVEMKLEIERLRAENARLAAKAGPMLDQTANGLSMKITEKGGLSVYGLGRFPVTLYKNQWEKLADAAAEIKEYTRVNAEKFSTKPVVAKVPVVAQEKVIN